MELHILHSTIYAIYMFNINYNLTQSLCHGAANPILRLLEKFIYKIFLA